MHSNVTVYFACTSTNCKNWKFLSLKKGQKNMLHQADLNYQWAKIHLDNFLFHVETYIYPSIRMIRGQRWGMKWNATGLVGLAKYLAWHAHWTYIFTFESVHNKIVEDFPYVWISSQRNCGSVFHKLQSWTFN